jgi:release factor H-coupled RctB family protein
MQALPSHVSLLADPDVWMESEALHQLVRVASHPACVRAAGMPDLHPGRGIPIGAAFQLAGTVLPDLVGGDAGCGVLLVVGKKDGPRGDALERRVHTALEERLLPEVDSAALLHAAWERGPRGLAELPGAPELLVALAERMVDDEGPSGELPRERAWAEQLGSVGGGNHFAEIARVDQVRDRAIAARLGLTRDAQVVLIHTGSRALGSALAARYAARELTGADIAAYMADLRGAIRYARTNRLLVALRLLRAAGLGSIGRIASLIDLVHNAVEARGDGSYLHRKGAAPARSDEPTVVLGSRGSPSWVMLGRGAEASLCCVAHGAGRRMARSEALAKLKLRHTRASLARSSLGCRVLCDDTTLMYEEHPDAYKPIEPVVASLEAAGAAQRVASLVPLVTVKK